MPITNILVLAGSSAAIINGDLVWCVCLLVALLSALLSALKSTAQALFLHTILLVG